MKKLLRHKGITALAGLALAFVLGGASWATATLRATENGSFIVHFNDIQGITHLGGVSTIVLMGVIGAIAVLADLAIAVELADRDRRLGTALAVGALVFGILLFIAFAAILKVN